MAAAGSTVDSTGPLPNHGTDLLEKDVPVTPLTEVKEYSRVFQHVIDNNTAVGNQWDFENRRYKTGMYVLPTPTKRAALAPDDWADIMAYNDGIKIIEEGFEIIGCVFSEQVAKRVGDQTQIQSVDNDSPTCSIWTDYTGTFNSMVRIDGDYEVGKDDIRFHWFNMVQVNSQMRVQEPENYEDRKLKEVYHQFPPEWDELHTAEELAAYDTEINPPLRYKNLVKQHQNPVGYKSSWPGANPAKWLPIGKPYFRDYYNDAHNYVWDDEDQVGGSLDNTPWPREWYDPWEQKNYALNELPLTLIRLDRDYNRGGEVQSDAKITVRYWVKVELLKKIQQDYNFLERKSKHTDIGNPWEKEYHHERTMQPGKNFVAARYVKPWGPDVADAFKYTDLRISVYHPEDDPPPHKKQKSSTPKDQKKSKLVFKLKNNPRYREVLEERWGKERIEQLLTK